MNITVTITLSILAVVDSKGGSPPSPFGFFFTKAKFTSKKLVLDEYKICLKMLEMAILETQFFKNFWRGMPQTPLENSRLWHS